MKNWLLLILSFVSLNCFAQDLYDADLIPTPLKSRANAIIRNEETTVDMRSPNDVSYVVNQAITVLNKNGEYNARLVLFYDKNTVIKSIKGEIFNAAGKQVGKFGQSDFADESAVQDFSLFEDSRVKHYLPSVNVYPYTITYHYEIRYKQNLIIPDWVPKPANDVAVEKSRYTFICKPTDDYRVQTVSLPTKADETITEKQKTLVWNVANLAAMKSEPYSPYRETYQTSVKIAPKQFSYFNYKGNYSNWQELGKWTYDVLLKDRSALLPATILTIQNLVKDETSDKEKAKKIYQYLQNKTRYISVQVGIGGFQPIKAAEVDRLGYGDCKALVNYMQSLLAAVDIESYYCVVEAGNEKKSLDPNWASMQQGNHIILCLPLKGDTTWLECTSQKIPFGFLSDFTDDRLVLACTAEGGKLLRTPKYTVQDNKQLRNAVLTLDQDGNASGKLTTNFYGAQYDNRQELLNKPLMEQQKLLASYYDIDNINFERVNYVEEKGNMPSVTEEISFKARNYATINNDKVFLNLNAFNVKSTIPESRNRTLPVYINRGYTDVDTVTYQLPENILPIFEPSKKAFETEFGSYLSTAKMEKGKLIYVRRFVLNEGTFPADRYATFAKFIADVNEADRLKVLLSLKK